MNLESVNHFLEDGKSYHYRLGRAGRNAVEWEPWNYGPVYVMKRTVRFKNHPKGELLCVQPDDSAASFGGRDYDEQFNCFCVEDYYLEFNFFK